MVRLLLSLDPEIRAFVVVGMISVVYSVVVVIGSAPLSRLRQWRHRYRQSTLYRFLNAWR